MVMIPCLQTNEARRTLGVWLAPDRNNDEEYKHLLDKANLWKNNKVTTKIPCMAADFSLHQVLLPKLRYPLIAMTLSEKQCQIIMKPIMTQGPPAISFNRHFPQAVAHRCLIYQGLNLPNLFTEQLIIQVSTLVKYGHYSKDPMGCLLCANTELLQLETGMSGPLFQIPSYFEVCVMPTWLSQCWLQCIQCRIEISTDIPDLLPLQEHDKELMQIFAEQGNWAADLATLNKCCMYLHAIFLSDICNASSTEIELNMWSGAVVADTHNYHWPQTTRPTLGEWSLWQRSLQQSLNLGQQ